MDQNGLPNHRLRLKIRSGYSQSALAEKVATVASGLSTRRAEQPGFLFQVITFSDGSQ